MMGLRTKCHTSMDFLGLIGLVYLSFDGFQRVRYKHALVFCLKKMLFLYNENDLQFN